MIKKVNDTPIGSGSYGTCYLAHYRDIKVAVKEMRARSSSLAEHERCRKEVLHEAKVINSLGDHPNIPLLLGICSVKEPYCIVLQHYGTDSHKSFTLQKAISRKILSKSEIVRVFIDICKALQYIHEKGYLHNDIKSLKIPVINQ